MEWNKYPYTNFHEMNLDWILSRIREMESSILNFVNLNTIKYADPIAWNITTQYEGNTVVIDNQTGNAYISTKPVPSGVTISNTDYWTQIFNYANELDTLRSQIAANEEQSTTATAPREINDLVFVRDELLKITAPMIAGDSYVVGSNCVKTTISEELKTFYNFENELNEEIQNRIESYNTLSMEIDNESQIRAAEDELLSERIDNVENSAQYKLLVFPRLLQGELNPTGECSYIKLDNECILNDLGMNQNINTVINSLRNHGINTVKYVTISHWHIDHTSNIVGFETLKNNLNMDDTVFYIPNVPAYIGRPIDEELKAIFPDNTFIYPEEGDELTYKGVKITFYNTGRSTTNYWNVNWNNDENSFSMCQFISYGSTNVAMTHDITPNVQEKLFNDGHYMPCVLSTAPHHGHNVGGSSNLALEIGAKMLYANNALVETFSQGVRDKYITTLAQYGAIMYTNSSNEGDVEFALLENGGIPLNSGNALPIGGYSAEDVIDIYVDSTSTSIIDTGSQKNPFKSIRNALSHCNPSCKYTIHIVNCRDDSIVVSNKNVVIDLNGKTVGFTGILYTSNCEIKNGTCGTISIEHSSNIILRDITCDNITTTKSVVNIERITTRKSIGVFIDAIESFITCLTLNNTFTITSLFKLRRSVLNGYIALGTITQASVTQCVESDTSSLCTLNSVDNSTNLTKLYGGVQFMPAYNTTTNKPCVIRNGSIVNLVTQ